jgi:signal transduction histidine kinase
MKLRWKICLSILLVLALSMGAGGAALITRSFTSELAQEREKDGASFQMIWQILNTTEKENAAVLLTQMESQHPAWAGIQYADTSGIIYESKAFSFPEIEANTQALVQDTSGHRLYFSGDLKDGTLMMAWNVDALYESRSEQIGVWGGIYAAVMLAGTAIALWLGVSMTRPLEKLSRAARRMTDGDLTVELPVAATDECGELTKDFNRMARQIEKNQRALEETAARQEEFVGAFTHELKTPLTAMIGYAELLQGNHLSEAESKQAALYIFREGQRLSALSRKLLSLLAVQNEAITFTAASPKQILADIASEFLPRLQLEGIALCCDMQEGECFLDEDLFHSLMGNLIDNACKAMERGGTITVTGNMTEHGCRICVRDTGRGVPAQELAHLTEAFYRVDKSRSRAQGGAGLGLALCQKIVQVHGGTMSFESEVGRGTCVSVELQGGRP